MTTLQTFQNEIHEIHNREVSKQRAQVNLDQDKETRKHSNLKGKVKEDPAESDVHVQSKPVDSGCEGSQLQEIEEQILVRLHRP